MVRLRSKSLFSWQHPLIELNGISMYLFNIRSWNGHLEHFISDKKDLTYFSIFCFAEANMNDAPAKHNEIRDDWKYIHKNTQNGLAQYCKVSKENIMEIIEIHTVLKVLPIALEIKKEAILLLIVYHIPAPLGSFIDDLFHWSMNCQHDTWCWLLVILILIFFCLSMLPKLVL